MLWTVLMYVHSLVCTRFACARFAYACFAASWINDLLEERLCLLRLCVCFPVLDERSHTVQCLEGMVDLLACRLDDTWVA